MHRNFILIVLVALIGAQLACVQDCMGSTVYVSGKVQDQDGSNISGASVLITNEENLYSDDFKEVLETNSDGRFESDSHFMYACDPIKVYVSATGYEEQTLTFHPIGEGYPDELPNEVVVILERTP